MSSTIGVRWKNVLNVKTCIGCQNYHEVLHYINNLTHVKNHLTLYVIHVRIT